MVALALGWASPCSRARSPVTCARRSDATSLGRLLINNAAPNTGKHPFAKIHRQRFRHGRSRAAASSFNLQTADLEDIPRFRHMG